MIKLAKLVSQEFVIGRHVDNILTNVAALNFNTNATTGEQGLKIVPYMAPVTQSLAKLVAPEKIIWMEEAPQQLQISYLELIKSMLKQVEEMNAAAEKEKQHSKGDNHD